MTVMSNTKHILHIKRKHLFCIFVFSRIGEGLETCLPNLETLVLTNNSMQDLVSYDIGLSCL